MITDAQIQCILRRINSIDELTGCRVGLRANSMSRTIQESIMEQINYDKIIIIEETEISTREIEIILSIDETSHRSRHPARHAAVTDVPSARILNRSRQGEEMTGAALSCGFAALSWIGVAAGALGAIPTGGASTVLTVAAWTGAVTGSIQCVNGLYRVNEAYSNPDSNSLQQLDGDRFYNAAMFIVDAVGVVSGIVGGVGAYRSLRGVLFVRGALPATEALAGMSQAEQASTIRDAVRTISRTEEGRHALAEALRIAASEAEIAQAVRSARSIASAQALNRTLLRGLTAQMALDLSGLVSTPVGIGVNLMPSSTVGSASGSLTTISEWSSADGMESNVVGQIILHVIQEGD